MDWVNLGAPGGLLFPREGTLELLPLSPLQAPFESVLVSALLVLHRPLLLMMLRVLRTASGPLPLLGALVSLQVGHSGLLSWT